jgi:methyl-accepting chemotaxis protein
LVQEISAASRDQNQSVAQIGGAMVHLNQATQNNAAASEELAATAEELSGQAAELKRSVSFFNLGHGSASTKSGHVEGDRRAPSSPMRGANKPAATSSGVGQGNNKGGYSRSYG